MPQPEASTMQTRSVTQIKRDIERRAAERQACILRGEVDVPVHYRPLPLSRLFEMAGQIDYRVDFLELAALSESTSVTGRVKVFLKALVCRMLRWLLIRQVEFNRLVLENAVESARQLTATDHNTAELYACVRAMRLQIHSLAERVAQLEQGQRPGVAGTDGSREFPVDLEGSVHEPVAPSQDTCRDPAGEASPVGFPGAEKHLAYLGYLQDRGPVLNIGCGYGDAVRTFLAEGIAVEGLEPDQLLADYCRERDLPVECEEGARYLERLADDLLGGIYLEHVTDGLALEEVRELLRRCWRKLRKGGTLIVEMRRCSGPHGGGGQAPAEWLDTVLTSEGFTLVDHVFSGPLHARARPVVQASAGQPYDQKHYRDLAVIGRK